MNESALQRFAGLTAVVTGAGSGIGRATVQRLLAEGATVVAVDISSSRLAELQREYGAGVTVVEADVADPVEVTNVVQAAGSRIDCLVNNAGIMDGFLPPAEVTDEVWRNVLAVNLDGPMRLTRALLPGMIAAGRGSIVNVASEASFRGSCAGAAYTASKHALIGLTRSVAVMHKGQGIRCNAVAPGGVATNVDGSFQSTLAQTVVGPILHATLPPIATSDQVAATIAYILSEEASNINGAVIACDGGWSAI